MRALSTSLLLVLGLVTQVYGCGVRYTGFRILGGNVANSCRVQPWAVFINNRDHRIYCSASIIGPRTILTAGHCIQRQGRNDPLPRSEMVDIRTGNVDKFDGILRKVYQTIPHPRYDHVYLDNDIAVVTLREPIRYDECHQPLCLGYDVNKPPTNRWCMVTGWGSERMGGRTSPVLKWTWDMPLTNEQCYREYYKRGDIKRFLCGKEHSSFCSGDSGGPLLCEENNKFYQYGVVSAHKAPGCGGTPGLYMRVPYYHDWIVSNMR